jgi:hypothetical protein
MLNVRISGIPCKVQLTHYSPGRCNRVGHIDNWLPDDPTELEFQVYDTRGYPADWLAKKMTDEEAQRIENLLIEEMNDEY